MKDSLIRTLSLMCCVLFATSCNKVLDCTDVLISYVPGIDYVMGTHLTTIKIKSSPSTNNGSPFYVLVKSTDFPTFLIDDYDKMTKMVIHPPEDLNCFRVECILPGKDLTLEMETPNVKSLGVYFLFTDPGDVWKDFFELEEYCATIKIVLGHNQILSFEI